MFSNFCALVQARGFVRAFAVSGIYLHVNAHCTLHGLSTQGRFLLSGFLIVGYWNILIIVTLCVCVSIYVYACIYVCIYIYCLSDLVKISQKVTKLLFWH